MQRTESGVVRASARSVLLKRESSRWPRLAVGALVVALSACDAGNADDAPVQIALQNGTRTNQRTEVGKYWSPYGGGPCTMTMISNRTFVTAARCHSFAPMSTGGTVDLPDVGLPGLAVERTFSQGGKTGNDDIAFGRLAAPVTTITPAVISTTEPSNTTLTAFGYGCTDGTSSGCTSGGNKNYVQYFYNGSSTYFGAPGGDWGGPTFLGQLADRGFMVRILSDEHTTPLVANGTSDVGADVVQFREHIYGMDNALNGQGVSYRAHFQNDGWKPAVQSGAQTVDPGLRLEALQVWSPIQGLSICYNVHAFGSPTTWSQQCDGNMAGFTGFSDPIDQVQIWLANPNGIVGLSGFAYNVYVHGVGWDGWKTSGTGAASATVAGRAGLQIEGIQIQPLFRVAIRTSDGVNFVTAENDGGSTVSTNRTGIGPWEVFEIEDVSGHMQLMNNDYVRIRHDAGSGTSYYATADSTASGQSGGGGPGSLMRMNRTVAGAWELFRIVKPGGGNVKSGDQVNFESINGDFASANNGGGLVGDGSVATDRTVASTWETFTLIFQ